MKKDFSTGIKRIDDRFNKFKLICFANGVSYDKIESMSEPFPCFIDYFVETSKQSDEEVEEIALLEDAAKIFATDEGYAQTIEALDCWTLKVLMIAHQVGILA